MKQIALIPLLCCLLLAIAGCGRNRSEEEFPTAGEESVAATATLDFAFEDSRAACQATSECILMKVGGCENVQAIHLSQMDLAAAYTERSKKEYPNVVCAPDFPIKEYEAVCLNQKCRAVLQNYRLFLEVPEQPVVGKPFWVGMSFRFHVAADEVHARFILPEHLVVMRGETSWIGSVNALEDHVMWVEVISDTPGKIYLSSWADIKQGDTSVPPLSWSEYFTIVADNSLSSHPMGAPILPTPTQGP